MDGEGLAFDNATWALGFFPNSFYDRALYNGAAGDIYLNLNSEANYLKSSIRALPDFSSRFTRLVIHSVSNTRTTTVGRAARPWARLD